MNSTVSDIALPVSFVIEYDDPAPQSHEGRTVLHLYYRVFQIILFSFRCFYCKATKFVFRKRLERQVSFLLWDLLRRFCSGSDINSMGLAASRSLVCVSPSGTVHTLQPRIVECTYTLKSVVQHRERLHLSYCRILTDNQKFDKLNKELHNLNPRHNRGLSKQEWNNRVIGTFKSTFSPTRGKFSY